MATKDEPAATPTSTCSRITPRLDESAEPMMDLMKSEGDHRDPMTPCGDVVAADDESSRRPTGGVDSGTAGTTAANPEEASAQWPAAMNNTSTSSDSRRLAVMDCWQPPPLEDSFRSRALPTSPPTTSSIGTLPMTEVLSVDAMAANSTGRQSTTMSDGALPHRSSAHLDASQLPSFSVSANVTRRGETLDSVNDLEFILPIGRGSQATVWMCVDAANGGEERAVKVIDRSRNSAASDEGDEGLPEVKAAMLLQHPNVIKLYEVIDDPLEKALFLVMEFIEGGPSGTVDEATGECTTALTIAEVGALAFGAACALKYCHETAGVVHGDIKPENILVDRSAPTGEVRAVVADFGVSKLSSTCLSDGLHSSNASHDDHRRQKADALSALFDSMTASSVAFLDQFGTSSSRRGTHATSNNDDVAVRATDISAPDFWHPPTALKEADPSSVDGGAAAASVSAVPLLEAEEGDVFLDADVITFIEPPEASSVVSQRPLQTLLAGIFPDVDPGASSTSTDRGVSVTASSIVRLTREMRLRESSNASSLSRIHSEVLRAKFAHRGPTVVGGTPAFQSPEMLDGSETQPTAAADMWALGVTLYCLLYKRLPFHGATWGDLRDAVCNNTPSFPVDCVRDREQRRWRRIVLGLLHKNPCDRTTASMLRRELNMSHRRQNEGTV